jgi:hypothetical protein
VCSPSSKYVGNEAPIGTAVRVIKSADGGTTWTNASAGLLAVPVTKLIVSTRDPNTGMPAHGLVCTRRQTVGRPGTCRDRAGRSST